MSASDKDLSGNIWYVYDGDCPLCRTAATYFRVCEAVGNIHLINAREEKDHPVIVEINTRHLNIDEGIVVKFDDNLYHGADAIGNDGYAQLQIWLVQSLDCISVQKTSYGEIIVPTIKSRSKCVALDNGCREDK